MARTPGDTHIPIETHKHLDTRVNIPTGELSGFVADDEKAPKTLCWPRDPSLDPQLVWKGKDGSDEADLEIPSVPIYIQEKIHPQALIENVRAEAKRGKPSPMADLFGDFNGVKFEDMVDFYHHEQHWSNRMILGDSLLVMASLADKERLKGKVQMVYMDPPYGIKFGSNWQVSTRKRDVKDGKGEDATRQPEQVKAFRDTWELGIHSYLGYLRDRLVAARDLLTETGSCFVQIGDENVHLVRCVMDEVFGSENFVGLIAYKTTAGLRSDFLATSKDWICWYGRDRQRTKFRRLFLDKERGVEGATQFDLIESADGAEIKRIDEAGDALESMLCSGWKLLSHDNLTSTGFTTTTDYDCHFAGRTFKLSAANVRWKTTPEGMQRVFAANRAMVVGNTLRYKRMFQDFPVFPIVDVWNDTGVSGFSDKKLYVVQTNPKVIERCVLMTTDPGDLVLDPTCGGGTASFVAEQWGRRWITIDTSRVALALARTRLMAAKFPYYLLTDSPEGQRKESELTGRPGDLDLPRTANDLRKGFVYKRVPHVTLKSIANNEEIDEIDARWRQQLDDARARLNVLAKKKLQEWEVPREFDASWPAEARGPHGEFWHSRIGRQMDIDASIARRADTEYLVDQPYDDPKRIRVTGPFTVESLSPHRVLPADDDRPRSEKAATEDPGAVQFTTTILDNLRKAGVQNTRRDERLKFERLEPHAGRWIHASGEYLEKEGTAHRVGVHIGPEHGTVSADDVKEAAKEALKGAGFDLVLVCGLAFDPHAGETAKEFNPDDGPGRGWAVAEREQQYGRLRVLLVRMNPDLAMGGDLLKKTGAGNLFMVFGEPDVDLLPQPDGRLVVELKGVDIYDPTTGQVHASHTDDIACWFVDTDYNEESFFVRHAYFTGAGEPYDRLKRALRAEIDEGAWSALYTTKSLPFDKPRTGKIAVKVINHYGDEVLKVFGVGG